MATASIIIPLMF